MNDLGPRYQDEWAKIANVLGMEKLAVKRGAKKRPHKDMHDYPISRALASPVFGAGLGGAAGAIKGGSGKAALVGAGVGATLGGAGYALRRFWSSRSTLGKIRKARKEGKNPVHYLSDAEKQLYKELKRK